MKLQKSLQVSKAHKSIIIKLECGDINTREKLFANKRQTPKNSHFRELSKPYVHACEGSSHE